LEAAEHPDVHYPIPLSILSSIIILVSWQTSNIMTLGDWALAVGMLVDDATVEMRTRTAIWKWVSQS